jgi:hypothetical protein
MKKQEDFGRNNSLLSFDMKWTAQIQKKLGETHRHTDLRSLLTKIDGKIHRQTAKVIS